MSGYSNGGGEDAVCVCGRVNPDATHLRAHFRAPDSGTFPMQINTAHSPDWVTLEAVIEATKRDEYRDDRLWAEWSGLAGERDPEREGS